MTLGEIGVIRAVYKGRFSVYPNQNMAWLNIMTFGSWSMPERLHTATVKQLRLMSSYERGGDCQCPSSSRKCWMNDLHNSTHYLLCYVCVLKTIL